MLHRNYEGRKEVTLRYKRWISFGFLDRARSSMAFESIIAYLFLKILILYLTYLGLSMSTISPMTP
jgi:hypothetical protein